jgi:hypothetical protein
VASWPRTDSVEEPGVLCIELVGSEDQRPGAVLVGPRRPRSSIS